MKKNSIASNLRLLADIAEGWNGATVPEIEKDTVLEGLREIYGVLKYGSRWATAEGDTSAVVPEVPVANPAAGTRLGGVETGTMVADASAGETGTAAQGPECEADAQSSQTDPAVREPIYTTGTGSEVPLDAADRMAPVTGASVSCVTAGASSPEPISQGDPATGGVSSATPAANGAADGNYYDIDITEVPAGADYPAEESSFIVNSPDEKEEFSQNILFDEGEIPVKPRLDRRALLSLYGDDPAPAAPKPS
ncbi:MAG: hypothetical protein LIO85_01420, partial [Rikenellaceae bacterium]|nr:hypothetical protein [Rikenellaceae bacterium]